MKRNDDFGFDDDFMVNARQTQRRLAVIGAIFSLGSFLLLVLTIYFFLAALGFVPAQDFIPFVPFV